MTEPVTVACTRCGGVAAEFSLHPAAAEGMPSRHGLQRAGFMGQVTKFGAGAELRGLLEAIRAADYGYDCTRGVCPQGHEQIVDD